jgi:hypothetical protein
MLDEEVAPALALAEQRAHLVERLGIDLAALRRAARTVASAPAAVVLVCVVNGAAP